jgi:hypothetical protein
MLPPAVLGDLLKINQHLVIYCNAPTCRRRIRWPAAEAVERLGFSTTFAQAVGKLRCAICGRRGAFGAGPIEVRPCSLDQSAWWAREKLAGGRSSEAHLQASLAMYRKLLGGEELGGDGPVQWPVEGSSNGG